MSIFRYLVIVSMIIVLVFIIHKIIALTGWFRPFFCSCLILGCHTLFIMIVDRLIGALMWRLMFVAYLVMSLRIIVHVITLLCTWFCTPFIALSYLTHHSSSLLSLTLSWSHLLISVSSFVMLVTVWCSFSFEW